MSKLRSSSWLALILACTVLPILSSQAVASTDSDRVGDRKCNRCHSEEGDAFALTVHAHSEQFGKGEAACEGCHGPGAKHAESEEAADILNPKRMAGREGDAICLDCHENAKAQQHWQGSAHDTADVGCSGCHRLHGGHQGLLAKASETELCIDCHREKRSAMRRRSTHPLRDVTRFDGEGEMTCTSCHGPHGTVAESLVSANTINEKCYQCHQEKKAPLLWEHSVVKEDCLACHNAHGSNHEMMLNAKEPRLCQQCHEQGRHQTLANEASSFFVVNRGCSNCHAAIHGTNNPSGIKLKN